MLCINTGYALTTNTLHILFFIIIIHNIMKVKVIRFSLKCMLSCNCWVCGVDKNVSYVTVVLERSVKLSKSIELAFVSVRIRAVLHSLHNRWSSNG